MTDWYDYSVTHGYITDYQGPNTDTPHYAFDLATPMDTPFWFPVSGTIEQADYAVWNGKQGGGEVFIKPDNGWPEEYVYHLDQIDVTSGQHVNAGDIIGLTGGQNSGGQHPTDPMWSSGPHLHIGEFDNYTNTPDGSRPYGRNPQYIIDMAKLINLTGGIDTQNQILGAETSGINTSANAVQSVGNIFQSIGNAFSFLQNGGLLRIGMFIVGGAVAVGGVVLVAKQ